MHTLFVSAALKWGIQKDLHQFQCQTAAQCAGTHAHHIGIIVQTGILGRKRICTECSTNAADLIGSDRHANACAANQNSHVTGVRCYCGTNCLGNHRIIGSLSVTATVLHFQLPFFQQCDHFLLSLVTGVVASNPNLHVLLTPLFYTALPAAPAALPAFGRVDTSWFADAAFLGDSLTAGFCVNEYNIDVGGALVCGYEGISPNTVVNRATVTSPDRGEEVPLDVLAVAQPAKLYILIGTNALVQPGNDDSFLAYYGKMLDDLRTALPNTVFYVQSVLPATQEKVADSLPGLAPDRLAVINAAIQQLCAERGCYYLDLSAEFADDAGYLSTEFSQPDGVHLTVSGYSRWVSYLCTHVPYSKDNPYQAGSTYYLSEDMKGLLSDLP